MANFFDQFDQPAAPQAGSIPPAGRALLDTIAGTESPGYDVLYGGRRFADFADHPRQAIPITTGPNAGKVSTAAGRYQFLSGTWDDQAKKLGLTSFAPENQDAAAWNLAQEAYRARTRRDLAADLEAAKGDPGALRMIGGALSGTWTSLPGGIEANRTADSFGARYMKALGQQSAQAATPSNPGGARFEELNFPTLPPAGVQNASATPAGAAGNFFDQFDTPTEPSPAGRGISDAGGVMRPEAPGVMEDVARSAGAGLVRGVAGSIPAQGGGSAAVRAAQLAAGAQPTGGVTSPEQAVEAVAGPLHKPQTTAGEYAQTIGEFAPAAFMPGGAIRRAANVVVPAVASETAGQATKGTAAEVPARLAAGIAGALVTARPGAASVSTQAAVPTAQELKAAAAAGFASPEVTGLEIAPRAISDFAARMRSTLDEKGIHEVLSPATSRILSALEQTPDSAIMTGQNLLTLRRTFQKAAGAVDPTERLAAKTVLNAIDDFLPNVAARDILSGDPKAAAQAWATARGNYAAAMRSEDIAKAVLKAQRQAESAGSGANIDNATRQQFKAILNNDKKLRGFSADEIAQMEAIVRGTTWGNLARLAGKAAPTGVVSGALSSGAGFAFGGGPGAVLLPIAGLIGKKLGDRSTAAAVQRLDELVRSRAPLSKAAEDLALKSAAVEREGRTARTMSALAISARNFATNLNDAGIKIAPTEILRSIQAPASGRAEDNQ